MIFLTDTNDKITVTRSSAANIDCVGAWIDVASGTGTPGKSTAAFSSAATGDFIVAPGASTVRTVKHMNFRNRHASLSCDVTVLLDDNGTTYELFKATLDSGEHLTYNEGIGWFLYETQPTSVIYAKLTSDLSANTTTTLADATGLGLSVSNGGYYNFEFNILYQAAATTTGLKLTVTTPTFTQMAASVFGLVSTAAGGTANIYFDVITSSGDAVVATGTPAATTTHHCLVKGNIVPSADGTVQLQTATEVAASNVTVKQGSLGRAEKWPA